MQNSATADSAVDVRQRLRHAKRLVVKIGSRSLLGDDPTVGRFAVVAAQIAAQRQAGRSVVLVSSGAVLFGWRRLGLKSRPKLIGRLQAAGAAGQSLLMKAYEDAFAAHGLPVAEVLLTHADLEDRERYLNARCALDALLELGAVPIINENGTVAFDELAGFGDNDQLASMVATLVGADLLVLLTEVEGLLDAQGARVPTVRHVEDVQDLVHPKESADSLGGMAAKLQAAGRAARRGVPAVLADARDADVLARLTAGDDVGTLLLPHHIGLTERKHWIAFTRKARGAILIDEGAVQAITVGKRSLLFAGVLGVRGEFDAGDAVRILGPEGDEIGRGLCRYAIADVARLAGAQSDEVAQRLGRRSAEAVVHRNDLVIA